MRLFVRLALMLGACSPAPAPPATTPATKPSPPPPPAPPGDAGAAAATTVAVDAAAVALGEETAVYRLADSCSDGPSARCEELRAACQQRDIRACRALAQVYRVGGSKVAQDMGKARELLERACVPADTIFDGCVELLEFRCHGWGAAASDRHRDSLDGISQMLQLCDRDYAPACRILGLYHSEGLCDIPYNAGSFSLGASFYQRACELGEQRSCASLAELYRAGHGVPRDPQKARRLLEDACTRGYTSACDDARAP